MKYMNSRIDDLETDAHRAIAGACAMSRATLPLNLNIATSCIRDRVQVGAGIGIKF